VLAVVLSACAGSTVPEPASTTDARTAAPSVLNPATIVVSTEPWSYAGKRGQAIQTANYRFYVTESDPVLIGRLPLFMETALAFYRSSYPGLPAPPGKLDTFLMGTRGQWETLTRQLMGDSAETYLRIQRGGFASGGRGVYYNIGMADTLSIAGHEGWHQYTQRTFKEPLPIWLEEGIATTMEGYRWDGSTPVFLPWSNTERFDQLRSAAAKDELMPLLDIFDASPQELLAPLSMSDLKPGERTPRRGAEAALTYYAQIWVLVHFLREGEGGKYRAGLNELTADAARGRIGRRLSEKLGERPARAALMTRKGPAVALAYFDEDLDRLAQEYARFVEVVVRPGSRGPVVDGKSPFAVN
jgi:hypothetical protein